MPIIPLNTSDIQFEQRDLFLDVRLTTININDSSLRDESGFMQDVIDYTGKKTFNVSFFKDGIGFGITSIKISSTSSLQPTVEIEFKDLYGKTVFGDSDEGIYYQSLFQWPPPKFEFTFKGYLGKPSTWLLNMKTTSTTYNSGDGSYTIKATFVPNQWGMFGDIPFLYLFAAKKLRADSNGSRGANGHLMNTEEYNRKNQSIIDLMYSGKKINKIKQQKTKEYDKIENALRLLKSDPIGGILSGIIKIKGNTVITSEIPARGKLNGFYDIEVKLPKDGIYEKSEEEIVSYLKNLPSDYRVSENRRIKSVTSGKKITNNETVEQLNTYCKNLDATIEINLKIIQDGIKAILYLNNSEEIKKLTISEVFSQIAKDTAFVMGFILDAGEQGYFNNITEREEAEKNDKIIGLYYPMKIEPLSKIDENGETSKKVPVKGYGTEEFEKEFVNQFINSISYGISQNRILQAQAENSGDNKIKHRINNIELISQNPFTDLTDWREIASLIMKRAAVAGYITQSNDPNKPGDYADDSAILPSERMNDSESMRALANNDIVNIQDTLNQLEPETLEELKNFCIFWMNVITDPEGRTCDEKDFSDLKWTGGNVEKSGDGDESINRKIVVLNPGIASLANDSYNLKIVKEDWKVDKRIFSPSSRVYKTIKASGVLNTIYNEINLNYGVGLTYRDAGFKAYTVEQYLQQFIGPNYLFNGRSTAQAKRNQEVIRPTLNATFSFYDTNAYMVYFNGLCFVHCVNYNNTNTNVTASSVVSNILNPTEAILETTETSVDAAVNGISKHEWLVFTDLEDTQAINEFEPSMNQTDSELSNIEEETKQLALAFGKPLGIIKINSFKVPQDLEDPQSSLIQNPGVFFINKKSSETKQLLNYNWCKSQNSIPGPTNIVVSEYVDAGGKKSPILSRGDLKGEINFTKKLVDSDIEGAINVDLTQVSFVAYGQTWDDENDPTPAGNFFEDSIYGISTRAYLRQFCRILCGKIDKIEKESNELLGQILGKGDEHQDLLYEQMHNLFHQWQILAATGGKRINQPSNPSRLTANVATKLEEVYGKTHFSSYEDNNSANNGIDSAGGFRYDYPLQSIGSPDGKKPALNVADSIINIDHLYEAKSNTTVLNVFQQVSSKNNFTFFPIAGNAGYSSIKEIFEPETRSYSPQIGNYFQVLFQPTPENRALGSVDKEPISKKGNLEEFLVQAFPVSFGDPENKIVKNISVSTDENKVTAESIVNLQKITDNDNKNKSTNADCSSLSVFEGRSYTAKLETLGNAQISPMQFFYLKNQSIFTGLYQINKVEHDITPNDMTTSFEGIKMKYDGKKYGGIPPITLANYENALKIIKEAPMEKEVSKKAPGTYEATAQQATVEGENANTNNVSENGDVNINNNFGPGDITLGSSSDWWALLAICTLEAGVSQSRADVAQSIYNRLATPKKNYGKSIKEIIIASGQYEPTFKNRADWVKIKDEKTALKAIMNSKGWDESKAKSQIKSTRDAILDKNLQINSRNFVETRTEFLAYKPKSANAISVIERSLESNNNAFYWQYAGKVLKGTTPPSPPDWKSLGINTDFV